MQHGNLSHLSIATIDILCNSINTLKSLHASEVVIYLNAVMLLEGFLHVHFLVCICRLNPYF